MGYNSSFQMDRRCVKVAILQLKHDEQHHSSAVLFKSLEVERANFFNSRLL